MNRGIRQVLFRTKTVLAWDMLFSGNGRKIFMSIKQKFLVSFGILLGMVSLLGVVMLRQVNKLGDAVDVILRENYQSVVICQNVNEALERIDSGLLLSCAGWPSMERKFLEEQIAKINRAWDAEMQNITVPGEGERAEKVRKLFSEYVTVLHQIIQPANSTEFRRTLYQKRAYPLLTELKKNTGEILMLNQNNMLDANNAARLEARRFHNNGLFLLAGCIVFIFTFSLLLTRWVQHPLEKLIAMTDEISNGNLSLALEVRSKDEIGHLSRSFNTMASALRTAQGQLVSRLTRSERMNKDIFSELPTAIAVFNAQSESIEVTTQSAAKYFGFEEGTRLDDLKFEWLREIFTRAKQNGVLCNAGKNDGVIQHFIEGKEYFFQPTGVPIPAGAPPEQITSVAVIMKDVTMAHEQQELKRSVISTVSHQLKTPLTSLQMSVYLLLEEKCGPLTPEQLDLLMAMRDDSERLSDIISDLLDLNRISKSGTLPTESHTPNELLLMARDRFLAECQEHSIKLEIQCDPLAPAVPVTLTRINYAFDNLIRNAIRYTSPGEKIVLSAKTAKNAVEFSVSDTGCGMTREVQSHLFEPFYRGPHQDSSSGIGLGLAIVKEVITAHGGKISVRSKEKAGTTFTFTLPVSDPAAKQKNPDCRPAPSPKEGD